VHCFAHQLQLALVACAKAHKGVSGFFGNVNILVNFIRASNKRQGVSGLFVAGSLLLFLYLALYFCVGVLALLLCLYLA
jgi:hypothetical protein